MDPVPPAPTLQGTRTVGPESQGPLHPAGAASAPGPLPVAGDGPRRVRSAVRASAVLQEPLR